LPRSLSFKGALQTLAAFQPLLELQAADDRVQGLRLYQSLLDAIAAHGVGERPNRFEPRAKKHRRNHYGWLTKPRSEVKHKMAKRVTAIEVPFVLSPEFSIAIVRTHGHGGSCVTLS
jgi:hypothetical protein